MIRNIGKALLGAGATVLAVNAAQANLLVNGSFEETGATTGSWFLVDSSEVPGWDSDAQIEIWDTYGLTSYAGSQHVELNADGSGPWSIWQDFDTQAGAWYTLSFAAAARTTGSEEMIVNVGSTPFIIPGDELLNESLTKETAPILLAPPVLSESVVLSSQEWQIYNFGFTAATARSRVTFTSVTPTGTMGNLLDDVKVVPAPSTLALFALGFVGVGSGLQRRARR